MTATALFITIIVIALAVYDLVVVVIGSIRGNAVGYSISRFLQWMPTKAPFFVLAVGYVLGHAWGFLSCPPCAEDDLLKPLKPEVQTEPLPPRKFAPGNEVN